MYYDNLECLKYIIEELQDVYIDIRMVNIGPNCKSYIMENEIINKFRKYYK